MNQKNKNRKTQLVKQEENGSKIAEMGLNEKIKNLIKQKIQPLSPFKRIHYRQHSWSNINIGVRNKIMNRSIIFDAQKLPVLRNKLIGKESQSQFQNIYLIQQKVNNYLKTKSKAFQTFKTSQSPQSSQQMSQNFNLTKYINMFKKNIHDQKNKEIKLKKRVNIKINDIEEEQVGDKLKEYQNVLRYSLINDIKNDILQDKNAILRQKMNHKKIIKLG